jgi:hypothetical protein
VLHVKVTLPITASGCNSTTLGMTKTKGKFQKANTNRCPSSKTYKGLGYNLDHQQDKYDHAS